MKIEILQPLAKYQYIWSAILVEDQYIIELNYTVWGSTNITLRRVGDYGLICNWCAGPDEIHMLLLLNIMLGYLEKDDIDLAPFNSRIKPAFNDDAFVVQVMPYLQDLYYISKIELLPLPGRMALRPCEEVDVEAGGFLI